MQSPSWSWFRRARRADVGPPTAQPLPAEARGPQGRGAAPVGRTRGAPRGAAPHRWPGGPAAAQAGALGPRRLHDPAPMIRSAELWYATTPAAGVWDELKIVLDNPLSVGATKTDLLVAGPLLEDFKIRSTEPPLL